MKRFAQISIMILLLLTYAAPGAIAIENASTVELIPSSGRWSHQTMPTVQASQILDMISNNVPIKYDSVIVEGDLILNELDKALTEDIKITNSIFEGNVSFSDVVFEDSVNVTGSRFEKSACFLECRFTEYTGFRLTKFHGNCTFDFSEFNAWADFSNASFMKDACFTSTSFDKGCDFYSAHFYDDAYFSLSSFEGQFAIFTSSVFEGRALFGYCSFDAITDLSDVKFNKGLDFRSCQSLKIMMFEESVFCEPTTFSRAIFLSEIRFDDSVFLGPAQFSGLRIDGSASFSNTSFDNESDFTKVQFNGVTDFTNAKFRLDLSLNGSKISYLQMDNSSLGPASRIFFNGASISLVAVPWKALQKNLQFDPSSYVLLVKSYKDLGWGEDANNCYYSFRKDSQDQKPWGLSKLLDTIAWVSCGYGVRPHYALFLGMAIIIAFAIAFWLGKAIYGPTESQEQPSFVTALFYSAIAFTANSKGMRFRGRYRYLGMAEGIIGWLLMALFLVTLGRIMIG